MGALLNLTERDQARSDDMLFGMFDRLPNVNKAAVPLGKQGY